MLSLRHGFAPYIVIAFLAITLLFLCLELHRFRWATLLPAVPAILAFVIALGVMQSNAVGTVQVHYSAAEGRDSLTLSRVQGGMICDVAGSTASELLSDWYALQERGVTELETLMLTDYRMQTPTALAVFSEHVIVRSLLLPEPLYPEDYTVQEQILAWAVSEEIPTVHYRYGQPFTLFGEGTMRVCMPLYESRSTLPALRIYMQMGSASLAFESCAYGEYARHLGKEERPLSDYLILGIAGPIPREAIRTAGAREGGTVIAGRKEALPQLDICKERYYFFVPRGWSVCLR
ncbi:MAG: hypothetical protein IJA78_00435 [Clostridia bacterium]|nr:hypothetical protein [Clostridia bacterium]